MWLLPGDMVWAYVLSAVLSVCGVSPGCSGRTVVAMTRNLKVQMSPLALCRRWYTVATRRKINKWPPLYFQFMFGILVRKACTCCLSMLYCRSELLGHWAAVCPLYNWLLLLSFSFFVEFGCYCSLHVFIQSVIQVSILLVSSFKVLMLFTVFSLPTSTWETFIYILLDCKIM